MSDKLLILYVTAGGGHKAAALALAEAANVRGIETQVVDALSLTPEWFAKLYNDTTLGTAEFTPEAYGKFFNALNQRNVIVDGVRGAFDRAVGSPLLDLVAREKPKAIVATHFFPLAVLGDARREGKLAVPLVGVVTDYNAHAFWAERGVSAFCAPSSAIKDLIRHGVEKSSIVATGIPVRAAFGRIKPNHPLTKCTDSTIIGNVPTDLQVLVTSGGFGVGPMVDIVRSFKDVGHVSLTLVCGDNPERVAEVKRIASEVGVTAEVIGFERDMPKRMEAAHIIVGKAGGLTVSESLAAGRPMLIVGAVPGQESLNAEWLVTQGAGAIADASAAGTVVKELLASGKLEGLAARCRAIAAPGAADAVIDLALRLAKERTSVMSTLPSNVGAVSKPFDWKLLATGVLTFGVGLIAGRVTSPGVRKLPAKAVTPVVAKVPVVPVKPATPVVAKAPVAPAKKPAAKAPSAKAKIPPTPVKSPTKKSKKKPKKK